MPRLTRVGNYYCRQDPPKARVWDDEKGKRNGSAKVDHHVLVKDQEGSVLLNTTSRRHSLRAFSSSLVKSKSKSLQSFSRDSIRRKIQRSMSITPESKKKKKKRIESEPSNSTDVDPDYMVIKQAYSLRTRTISSGSSRRMSSISSKESRNSECTHIAPKPIKSNIISNTMGARSYSISPSLFRRKCVKAQNGMTQNCKTDVKRNIAMPLRIEIPSSKPEAHKSNCREDAHVPILQMKQPEEPIETNPVGSNSPSAGSQTSSKSVHFAPEIKMKSVIPIIPPEKCRTPANTNSQIETVATLENNLEEMEKDPLNVSRTDMAETMIKGENIVTENITSSSALQKFISPLESCIATWAPKTPEEDTDTIGFKEADELRHLDGKKVDMEDNRRLTKVEVEPIRKATREEPNHVRNTCHGNDITEEYATSCKRLPTKIKSIPREHVLVYNIKAIPVQRDKHYYYHREETDAMKINKCTHHGGVDHPKVEKPEHIRSQQLVTLHDSPILDRVIKARKQKSKQSSPASDLSFDKKLSSSYDKTATPTSNYTKGKNKTSSHSSDKVIIPKRFQTSTEDFLPTKQDSKSHICRPVASVVVNDNQVLQARTIDITQNGPKNTQLPQKIDPKQSAILSKDVVAATGKIIHSKSTSNLREKHSTLKPLALPLSSALLLSGAYPGYRPPDSEIIPFVDDSIQYLVDDPPMSLTNVNTNDYQSCQDTTAKCSLFESESMQPQSVELESNSKEVVYVCNVSTEVNGSWISNKEKSCCELDKTCKETNDPIPLKSDLDCNSSNGMFKFAIWKGFGFDIFRSIFLP